MDAEAVLLVDDHEAERAEAHAFLEQRVGADRDGSIAELDVGERADFARALTSAQRRDAR